MQTIWIQIRSDFLSGLIWVQTVCIDNQKMTQVGKELKSIQNFIAIQILLLPFGTLSPTNDLPV